MRYLAILCLSFALATPAYADFRGPVAPPLTNAAEALKGQEGATCVLTGNITERGPQQDRYVFTDSTAKMTVRIPPHVFGTLDVTPETTVRLTGEIGGMKDPARGDAHLRVRYIELAK